MYPEIKESYTQGQKVLFADHFGDGSMLTWDYHLIVPPRWDVKHEVVLKTAPELARQHLDRCTLS